MFKNNYLKSIVVTMVHFKHAYVVKITINEAELSKDIFDQDKLYNTIPLLARKIFSLLWKF